VIPFGLGGAGVYIVSGPYDYHYDDDYHYDYDAVLGGYLGGGLHYNITPGIFVGVEGKYLWTDKAKLRDEVYGIPLEAKFKMDGIIATAVIGIRF
jgi:opacity protein-like surface antigen